MTHGSATLRQLSLKEENLTTAWPNPGRSSPTAIPPGPARINLFTLSVLCLTMAGCIQPSKWADSGIVPSITAELMLRAAGTNQTIKIETVGYHETRNAGGFESERRFQVRVSSGKVEDLFSGFRRQVEGRIVAKGAILEAKFASAAASGNVRDFTSYYQWHRNNGRVRVYFCTCNNTIDAIIICREDRP